MTKHSTTKEFKSTYSYRNFDQEVRHNNRFIRNKASEDFLEKLLETCKKRIASLSLGDELWRAQLGCDWRPDSNGEDKFEVPCAFGPERMKPLPEKMGDGRINPRRIAYLYLATDMKTAIAEVRPWVGAYVSIGNFKILQDLKLVDCTKDLPKGFKIYFIEPSPDERENAVWTDINRALSSPVGPMDDYAAYIPTQIIAELFKVNKYDGIIYQSSLGQGKNMCLFDPNMAKIVWGSLYKVKTVNFAAIEEEMERYIVRG